MGTVLTEAFHITHAKKPACEAGYWFIRGAKGLHSLRIAFFYYGPSGIYRAALGGECLKYTHFRFVNNYFLLVRHVYRLQLVPNAIPLVFIAE